MQKSAIPHTLVVLMGMVVFFMPLVTSASLSNQTGYVGDKSWLNTAHATFDESGSMCGGTATDYADYFGDGTEAKQVSSGALVNVTGDERFFTFGEDYPGTLDDGSYTLDRLYLTSPGSGDYATDFANKCDNDNILGAELFAFTYSRDPEGDIEQMGANTITVTAPNFDSDDDPYVFFEVGQDSWCTPVLDLDDDVFEYSGVFGPAENVVGTNGFIAFRSATEEPAWTEGVECPEFDASGMTLEGYEIVITAEEPAEEISSDMVQASSSVAFLGLISFMAGFGTTIWMWKHFLA